MDVREEELEEGEGICKEGLIKYDTDVPACFYWFVY